MSNYTDDNTALLNDDGSKIATTTEYGTLEIRVRHSITGRYVIAVELNPSESQNLLDLLVGANKPPVNTAESETSK